MLNNFRKLIFLWVILWVFAIHPGSAQIVIGGAEPDSSALLDLQSTNQGFLLPRLTQVQRDSIVRPAQGLQIFNKTVECIEVNLGYPHEPLWFQLGCLGKIDTIFCDSAEVSLPLTEQTLLEERSLFLPYQNANNGDYPELYFESQGVEEVTLRLKKGRFEPGNGILELEFSGTPQDTGLATFYLKVANQECLLQIPVSTGIVDSLLCEDAIIGVDRIIEGQTVDTVEIILPYIGGNGGPYAEDSIQFTGIEGMNAFFNSGYFGIGADNLHISLGGIPLGNGIGQLPVAIGGHSCSIQIYVIDSSAAYYPDGFVHCNPSNPTEVVEVLSPLTNQIWMDRNLGASRVAVSSNDGQAYGDMYQWGRFADGHQCRNSPNTTISATTPIPNAGNEWDGKFIIGETWMNPVIDTLWDGIESINNPCPNGYRIPTPSELEAERLSFLENDRNGAFESPLKFTCGGRRMGSGNIRDVGLEGHYLSNSGSGKFAQFLLITFFASLWDEPQATGYSVRCIKD